MSPPFFDPSFEVLVNDAVLEADLSHFISDVQIVHGSDLIDSCTLTFANPYPSLPWTHSDRANFFQAGKNVAVKLGYGLKLEQIFNGVITEVAPSFPASGAPTVRIKAQTQLGRLRGSPQTCTFVDKRDSEIAEEIARRLKLKTGAIEATSETHPYVIQLNQTDLAFLLDRARRNHYELRVEDKELIFRPLKTASTQRYTLVWGQAEQAIDPQRKILPLQSFNPSLNLARQVTQVVVRGRDPKSGVVIEGKAGPSELEGGMGKQSGPKTLEEALGDHVLKIANLPVHTAGEAKQMACAIFNQIALAYMIGNGATVGLPDLRVGETVDLAGLGPRFSGRYYLTEVTHSLGAGGYTTNFSVERSASG
jgi:uncharacterized protein